MTDDPQAIRIEVSPEAAPSSLVAALAAAQIEMQNPPLDATNPHFRSRFASMPSVRNAVVPTLAAHGIAVVQRITTLEGAVECQTSFMHASGETLDFPAIRIPVTKNDAQGYGIAMTYARRYSLLAAGVVAGDPDEDGSVDVPGAAAREPAPRADPDAKATAAQIQIIRRKLGKRDEAAFCAEIGVASLDVLPFDRVNECLEKAGAK